MKALNSLVCTTFLAAFSSSALALTDQEIVALMGGFSFILLTVAILIAFPLFIMLASKGTSGHIENQRKEFDDELRRLSRIWNESQKR